MRIGPRWLIFLALLSSAWAQDQPRPDPEEQAQIAVLNRGLGLLQQRRAAEAMTEAFDKMIAAYERKFAGDARKIYTARTSQESLLYLLQAANARQTAAVVGLVWSEAFYYRGYALVELGRLAEARAALERAEPTPESLRAAQPPSRS